MNNFTYSIPTTVFFGEGSIKKLPKEILKYADNVLIVYGGGSIKNNGIYDEMTNLLKENKISFCELSGVEPNPRITSVRRGVEIARENKINGILAIGGGSTIDCAKTISAAFDYEGDAWDLVKNPKLIKSCLPIFTVLTISATGSEMDAGAVISDMKTNDKLALFNKGMLPKASVLDPTYTYSVSALQTASGTADIISHILEVYFDDEDDAFMQNKICEALLKTCIKYGPKAIETPDDYEARANLMWTSSWAINGFISCGKGKVAWPVHGMEHSLSAYYDIPHGVGLALLTPYFMELMLQKDVKVIKKFEELAQNVFGKNTAEEAIESLRNYFKKWGLPVKLKELNIDKTHFEIMAEKAVEYSSLKYSWIPMDKQDVLTIYNMAL